MQRLGFSPVTPGKRSGKGKSVIKPIWIHALSVGEVLSAAPLIHAVRKAHPNAPLVFSATTGTGFEIARARFSSLTDIIFYYPFDLIFSVKHRINEISPRFVIIVETDIWPNFIFELKRKQIPVFLVNARLSIKSYKGYGKIGFFTRPLFSAFTAVLTQTGEDAERYRALGVYDDNAVVTGNLKFDQTIEPAGPEEKASLRKSLGVADGQRLILAGSTHEGEEPVLVDAFLKLKAEFGNLALVIVPRDIDRAKTIRKTVQQVHSSVEIMSETESGGTSPDIVIVDATGILKQLYALADIAFVGGSLARRGGHNPLEPAMYGRPVLFGPDMSNFKEISQMLLHEHGAFSVKDAGEIYKTGRMLLLNNHAARDAGQRAYNVFTANKGAVNRTIAAINGRI